ncbi:MAG: hypothetical protein AB1652_03795 [Bacillota bacterium]
MKTKQGRPAHELSEENRLYLREAFLREMVPLLKEWQGRTGVVNCAFAGAKYAGWNIVFKSIGSGFEIVEFECTERKTASPAP